MCEMINPNCHSTVETSLAGVSPGMNDKGKLQAAKRIQKTASCARDNIIQSVLL